MYVGNQMLPSLAPSITTMRNWAVTSYKITKISDFVTCKLHLFLL